MDEQVMAKYRRHLSEKVLRLFDETLSQEKFCSLREEWETSEVEPGDIVHITGREFLHSYCSCIFYSPKTEYQLFGWLHLCCMQHADNKPMIVIIIIIIIIFIVPLWVKLPQRDNWQPPHNTPPVLGH